MKRNRSSFDKLSKAIESVSSNETSSKDDTRFWQPQVDKAISGFGKERFIALSKDTSLEANTTNYNQPNDYTFGGPNTSARRQASQDLVQADVLKKISNKDRTPSFSIGSNTPQSPILPSRP